MRALTLALLALAAPAAPSSALAGADDPAKVIEDVRDDLAAWLGTFKPKGELSRQRDEWLGDRLASLGEALAGSASFGGYEALLDVAGYGLSKMPSRSSFVGGQASYRVRALGMRALDELRSGPAGPAVDDWLTRGVLPDSRRQPAHRRWVALYLLRLRQDEVLDVALLSVARDAGDPLRRDALALLPERTNDAIDRFLVANLASERRDPADPHPHNLLRRRLDEGALSSAASAELVRALKTLFLSADWRDASRAIELGRQVEPMRIAPMLVEALHAWQARDRSTAGARRTTWEIVRALRAISGRTIGANAKSWETWWRAVRDGNTPLYSEAGAAGRRESTATFFGLEAVSDQITFVIDHSGSMDWGWGNSNRTRFEEAIEQLMRFLQASGETTNFNIVLFSTSPVVSTPHLVPATPKNLERARSSLARRTPDGGTNLRSAIEYALGLDNRGKPNPDRLVADTIVVLCDGDTDTGPNWVRPLLDRVNTDLRVIFHCAQVGGRGDGSLQTLARLTGGDFIQVPGSR